jgi:rRNA maturation protein Rpf1
VRTSSSYATTLTTPVSPSRRTRRLAASLARSKVVDHIVEGATVTDKDALQRVVEALDED